MTAAVASCPVRSLDPAPLDFLCPGIDPETVEQFDVCERSRAPPGCVCVNSLDVALQLLPAAHGPVVSMEGRLHQWSHHASHRGFVPAAVSLAVVLHAQPAPPRTDENRLSKQEQTEPSVITSEDRRGYSESNDEERCQIHIQFNSTEDPSSSL